MDRVFNAHTGAAAGLIVGIILGSLALDLLGAGAPTAPAPRPVQSAAPAAGIAAASGAVSQR